MSKRLFAPLLAVAAIVLIPLITGLLIANKERIAGGSSVSGNVWIRHSDGSSLIQRGASVHLLASEVSPSQIMTAAQQKLAEIRHRAAGASEHAGIIEDADALKSYKQREQNVPSAKTAEKLASQRRDADISAGGDVQGRKTGAWGDRRKSVQAECSK